MTDELKRAIDSMVLIETEKRLRELTPQVIIDGVSVDHDRVEIEDGLIVIFIDRGCQGENENKKTKPTARSLQKSKIGLFSGGC